jgi:hypothetical protein
LSAVARLKDSTIAGPIWRLNSSILACSSGDRGISFGGVFPGKPSVGFVRNSSCFTLALQRSGNALLKVILSKLHELVGHDTLRRRC